MFRYRDRKVADKIIQILKNEKFRYNFMHVCGTHQDTLVRYGLDDMLKTTNIKLLQGPGCPVCVTTNTEIDKAITLAKNNKIVATFGDLLKVPGTLGSLNDAKTTGDVRVVYSIDDAIQIANKTKKSVVFVAVGFETTAPSTASAILNKPPNNFSILSYHRLIPPALKALISLGDVKIDGFIEPGHVSTIIGAKPYEFLSKLYNIPQVITGFEPLDLLIAIYMLIQQIKRKEAKVEIEYTRSVRYEGNLKAISLMNDVFYTVPLQWRGFPVIPMSGLKLKPEFEEWDAEKKYSEDLAMCEMSLTEPKGCICHKILRGISEPQDCSLFGKECSPEMPVGPCMVSAEGACNIIYKYKLLTR